uniref:CCR4-NOT transcription complex subunit 9 n=1 Tax=Vitis vinifera TaxID=29760 RepID=A5BMY1_VITVI|nr:hypothetical protein VITISV_035590 [Vitis vinifera]
MSLSMNAPFGGSSSSVVSPTEAQMNKDQKMASAESLVLELINPDLRENALLELSKLCLVDEILWVQRKTKAKNKELFQDLAPFVWNSFGTIAALIQKRELFQDLAPLLWNSFGTIAALLQEIVSIYPVLSPPNLTPAQSNRVCNALALLQVIGGSIVDIGWWQLELPSISKVNIYEFDRLLLCTVVLWIYEIKLRI